MASITRKIHSPLRNSLFRATVAAWITALCCACSPDVSDPVDRKTELVKHADRATPTTSLFAVGDTGAPWGMAPRLFEGQLAVGVSMQRAHARHPIDALILLGDNFYPHGLLAKKLLPRIVENLAKPYCAFIDPTAELKEHLDADCQRTLDATQDPPRLFAVVGNHDLATTGSEQRQREEIPRFIRNWDLPDTDHPGIRELPGGLSLIFLNSDYPWGAAATAKLADALADAKGPWRVIVGHRPPIAGHPQLSRMVARAVKKSGHPVHAYLAGHVHVMAAIRGALPAPALTVIAGSGSHAQRQDTAEYRIEDADLVIEELGFVRLDVLADETPARLRITLFQTPSSAFLAFLGNKELAGYEIELDGRVERLSTSRERN